MLTVNVVSDVTEIHRGIQELLFKNSKLSVFDIAFASAVSNGLFTQNLTGPGLGMRPILEPMAYCVLC